MKNLKELSTHEIMEQISRFAPFSILVFAVLSFVAVAIFKVDYYTEKFSTRFASAQLMAIIMAVISEGVRFALLISSARDFLRNEKVNGWLGLIASVGLVVYEWNVAGNIASVWSVESPELYKGIFIFLITIGLVLELRLILTLNSRASQMATTGTSQSGLMGTPNGSYNGYATTGNGLNVGTPPRTQMGFFTDNTTNNAKYVNKSVATPHTTVATHEQFKDGEIVQMALKNAKRFLSAYENKPDTDNNIQKRKEWEQKVVALESLL